LFIVNNILLTMSDLIKILGLFKEIRSGK